MSWCNRNNDICADERISADIIVKVCPSCGYRMNAHEQGTIQDLLGLPAGVKFDPTDQELLEHLEGKVRDDSRELHSHIDGFIPTLEGENGICYTHPQKLPGVNMDGLIRHFFHRPSKAYTTGTRKRRKVHTNEHGIGGETRWHKTGKTRPVLVNGVVKGQKKILVLYTNYGKRRKPEKTSWVMHQYHLGSDDEEKEGELVVSKVFYQTQPRQCGSASNNTSNKNLSVGSNKDDGQLQSIFVVNQLTPAVITDNIATDSSDNCYASSLLDYNGNSNNNNGNQDGQMVPQFSLNADGSPFLH